MIVVFFLSTTNIVNASIIDITIDNVGEIQKIESLSPEDNIGFLVGESLSLRFTFDDTTALTLANGTTINDNAFFDENAKLWLTGHTSGVTLEYFSGLIVEVDNKQKFELEGIDVNASADYTRIIGGDIDWENQGVDVFSDINSLPTIFSELFANPFTNKSTNLNTASTRFWANGSSNLGMTFGPVPETSNFTQTKVPEPTSLAILTLGLLALVSRKVRRR